MCVGFWEPFFFFFVWGRGGGGGEVIQLFSDMVKNCRCYFEIKLLNFDIF